MTQRLAALTSPKCLMASRLHVTDFADCLWRLLCICSKAERPEDRVRGFDKEMNHE